MKSTTLAILMTITATMVAPLAAHAGGHSGHKRSAHPTYQPTQYSPSNSNSNASTGNQSTDVNNANNIHNSNSNSANGGAGGNSNVDLNNHNNNANSNTNNVQGGAGGSSHNANEAYGGNAHGGNGYGGIGVGVGKGGEGGKGGTGGTSSAVNTNHVNSQGGTGYGGTGGTSSSSSQGGAGGNAGNSSSGSGNYTTIGGNHYNEATQAPQLGAPSAVPGNAGFAYNSYVCNQLQTSVAVSAGNKSSSTSGGINFIGFGIGGGNSNSDISFPKEYAAGMRTIPLQIAAGTLGSMSTLNVSEGTPSWFASMILRMSADPSDARQVREYNAIADQMATIRTKQIKCPGMQPTVNVTVEAPMKAVREYNQKRHQDRQNMRDMHDNEPKAPRRYRTDSNPSGNKY